MLKHFWNTVTRPLLEASKAKKIVEIGVLDGEHTELILGFCASNEASLESIDPAPNLDLESYMQVYGAHFRLYQQPSLEVIALLDRPDFFIIDGDHNWYTVYHELLLIHELSSMSGKEPPVILLHDISWPYGRRDCYYAPERIPPEYRHPYARKGLIKGKSDLCTEGGFNAGQLNAIHEGGPQNGVLTAVEDFLKLHARAYRFFQIPVMFGLGVIVHQKTLDTNWKIRSLLTQGLDISPVMSTLLHSVDEGLIESFKEHQKTKSDLKKRILSSYKRPNKKFLSIVLVVYNMVREAPRTIHSLTKEYQQNVDASEYEVIIVENGSKEKLNDEFIHSLPDNFHYKYLESAPASPAYAVNEGVRMSKGNLVGIMIDGARIATPGIVQHVLKASELSPSPIIFINSYLLGSKIQNLSISEGYNQNVEDGLLTSINWPHDGYRLFEVGCLAGSNSGGWFGPNMESNAIFMSREMWDQLGGMDERFTVAGGGFVNPDLLNRACEIEGSELIVIAGEGTFHQIHGGIATNSTPEELKIKSEPWLVQYREIRGKDYKRPDKQALIYGHLPEPSERHLPALLKDKLK